MFRARLSLWRYLLPIAFLIYVTVVVAGCKGEDGTPADKVRPEGVPAEALWIGGKDGGVYLLISQESGEGPHEYEATVYAEATGAVWYQGRLVLNPAGEQEFDYRDSTSYSSWDGDILYLRDGRTLQTVD